MLPSAYIALQREERAFIIAAIDIRTEEEKKARKAASRKR